MIRGQENRPCEDRLRACSGAGNGNASFKGVSGDEVLRHSLERFAEPANIILHIQKLAVTLSCPAESLQGTELNACVVTTVQSVSRVAAATNAEVKQKQDLD